MTPTRVSKSLMTLLATGLLLTAMAQNDATSRVITVVGRGIAYGEPDVATLDVGVTANDPDVRVAVQLVDQGITSVLAALQSLGVAEEDIRTTSYDVHREERHQQGGDDRVTVTFRAQHMLTVDLAGAEQAGEALAAAVEAGANAVGGIRFGFSNDEALASQARVSAVSDARRRAEELASAAGVALGAPITIEEVTGMPASGPTYERSAMLMSASPIAAGELSVEVTVVVRYELETR